MPVLQEPGCVIARTLRFGEPDTGALVHERPGDQLVLKDMVVELDHLDQQESLALAGTLAGAGAAPLTPVLFAWLRLGPGYDEDRTRNVLAAARRLDRATQLLLDVHRDRRRQLDGELDDQGGPAIRRSITELFGTVEVALVARGRAVDMVAKAEAKIDCQVPVPAQVLDCGPAVKAIRDALEHVEDRAVGQVHKPHPQPCPSSSSRG